MDSGFQILHSSLSELGFWIPIVSGIPHSVIPDSTNKLFPDSEFHKQKFSGFRNTDSVTWNEGGTFTKERKIENKMLQLTYKTSNKPTGLSSAIQSQIRIASAF